MKDFVQNHEKLLIVVVVVFAVAWVVCWPWPFASTRGRVAAHFDIGRGDYEIQAYGLPPRSRPEFTRLLRERYGVKVHTVALCIVSQSLAANADSYNSVSITAVNRKFGHDVLKECADEARKRLATNRAESD